MAIEVLHRNDLPLGGFAGLKEYRLVMSPKIFGFRTNASTWSGLAGFVYLADANFDPKGETTLHDHKEIDVISVMLEGSIEHNGSLEHGQALEVGDVQVQRAGGEGFSHNEINPDDSINRMLQLWVLPEQEGKAAGYKLYKLGSQTITRIYGGNNEQDDTFASHTVIEIVLLKPLEKFEFDKPFLAYLAKGSATVKNLDLVEGDLFKDDQLSFVAKSDITLIVIYQI